MKESEVVLAMKKRGFGAGKWNGVGGKVLPGELPETAIRREATEEIGVVLGKLYHVATLTFSFIEHADWSQVCEVYLATTWEGEPQESEEMAPQWFNVSEIPYDDMWSDDKYWLPQVLVGKKIKARFTFTSEQELFSHRVEEV